MPTGVGAGKAKICIYRVRGYPGLYLIFLRFGQRGEYGKVRYSAHRFAAHRVIARITHSGARFPRLPITCHDHYSPLCLASFLVSFQFRLLMGLLHTPLLHHHTRTHTHTFHSLVADGTSRSTAHSFPSTNPRITSHCIAAAAGRQNPISTVVALL